MPTQIAWEPALRIHDGHELVIYETDTPLGAAAVFSTPLAAAVDTNGAVADQWIARGDIRQLVWSSKADVAGAANGATVEESHFGEGEADETYSMLDTAQATTPGAGLLVQGIVNLSAAYFRVRYRNGAGAQGTFGLRVTGRK